MTRKLRTPERFAALYGSAPLVTRQPKPTRTIVKRLGAVRLVRMDYAAHVTQSRGLHPLTGKPFKPRYWGKHKWWAVETLRNRKWVETSNCCYYNVEARRYEDALALNRELDGKNSV